MPPKSCEAAITKPMTAATQGTLWIAGGKPKYYRHLSGWKRLGWGDTTGTDRITGVSAGSARTLTVTLDLSDALIEAGYVTHIDAAAGDFRDSPSDVVVPLTSAGAGAATAGRGYVASFACDM